MKTIKLMLDYKCYPVWVYDDDNIIENDISSITEFWFNDNLKVQLDEIQSQYDKLFIDDGIEFSYRGFESEIIKSKFVKKVMDVYEVMKNLVKEEYTVENEIDFTFL